MKLNKIFILILAMGLVLAACSTAPADDSAAMSADSQVAGDGQGLSGLQTLMIVGPQLVSCGNDGTKQCLQVKFDPQDEWQVMEAPIEGFDYVPGYRYTLLVAELDTQSPPDQAANAQFMLVEVQDQVEEAVVSIDDLANVTWLLVGMGDVSAPEGVLENIRVTLEYLPADEQIVGVGGCNRYFGGVAVDADQLTFTTAPMGMGRMACSDQVMAQEIRYIDILGRVNQFAIRDNLLYLFTGDNEVLMFSPETAS